MIDSKYLDELKEIADTLGYEEQSMQLIEEMAELTQAINKHRRYSTKDTLFNLIEELADVNIVLEQVISYFTTNIKEINTFEFFVDSKIKRTKQRLLEKGRNIE